MSPDPSKIFKSNDVENCNVNVSTNTLNGFSSDEDTENNVVMQDGYQLLSDEIVTEDMEENVDNNDEIDYSSLSGIMSALENNGPTVIEDDQSSCLETPHDMSRNLPIVTESDRVTNFKGETSALWNQTSSISINIDKKKEEEIKNAMAAFTLPASAIPPWAKNMSDEQWKEKFNLEELMASARNKY